MSVWSADITEALFVQYTESRDVCTRNEIVERYSPLAAKAASRYMRPGLEYEDLYQVAMMSLLRAIERFDSSKGVKFAAFALPTLLGRSEALHPRLFPQRCGRPAAPGELAAKLRRAESELAGQLGRLPHDAGDCRICGGDPWSGRWRRWRRRPACSS